MKRWFAFAAVVTAVATVAAMSAVGAGAQSKKPVLTSSSGQPKAHWCNTNGITCVEPYQNWEESPWFKKAQKEGVQINDYIGHDEPSLLFYSNKKGAGYDNTYKLTIPKDPPLLPRQDLS